MHTHLPLSNTASTSGVWTSYMYIIFNHFFHFSYFVKRTRNLNLNRLLCTSFKINDPTKRSKENYLTLLDLLLQTAIFLSNDPKKIKPIFFFKYRVEIHDFK